MKKESGRTHLKVLMLEISDNDVGLIIAKLNDGGFDPYVVNIESKAAFTQALRNQKWDLILADYVLKDFSGIEAFRMVKNEGLDVPFIIVSGKIGEDSAVEAMRSGVHDCIFKDNLVRLVPAVERELADASVRRAHREAQIALEKSQKQLERQKIRERELKILEQVVSGIAHEVRNPLNAISALVEAMFQEIGHNDDLLTYKKHITAQVDRLNRLTRELLDLGKPNDSSEFAKISLVELCAKTIELWNRAPTGGTAKINFVNNTNGNPARIAANFSRLQQVLMNLFENASFHSTTQQDIELYLEFDEKSFVIRIVDHGTGIPETVIDRIFEPFFTTRKAGTGLGLGIAKNIVEEHYGDLQIFNNPQGEPGVSAVIRFPRE